MYLGDACLAGVIRPSAMRVRALPNWTKNSAGRAQQGYALQSPHFQPVKPTFIPGKRYPEWHTCGNLPGSGSPCNSYARRRFSELQSEGHSFDTIKGIMQREGSFRHYAGF